MMYYWSLLTTLKANATKGEKLQIRAINLTEAFFRWYLGNVVVISEWGCYEMYNYVGTNQPNKTKFFWSCVN